MGNNKHWRARLEGIVVGERINGYREGRRKVLEEIVEKFGGGVYITIEGTIGGKKEVITARPELDVWIEKELDKLSSKDSG